MPSVKRTYSSRFTLSQRSSSPSELSSPPPKPSIKRPLSDRASVQNTRASKRPRLVPSTSKKEICTNSKSKAKPKTDRKPTTLTQLHFSIDTTVLRTCPQCDLTYTKGAPADEILHRSHCARVQRGMDWGRDEEREIVKAGVREIAASVKLKVGRKGRIICVRGDASGKVGSKIAILLETISLHLSSPALTPDILRVSKLYLFLLPSNSSSSRETIVGCVIAQQISTAMAIASAVDTNSSAVDDPPLTATLVPVDTDTGLFCLPTPLPTIMGIPRLFVPSVHRRQGIATLLLNAAASTFMHGYKLDPLDGDIAFTQPTSAGRAVMERWGGGGIRIYQE
ncbi:hypothetical protein OF83DRAFT_1137599 [Amylostereum chailletii]|nr:hypothetical protein OF83DRAFT_1137599 [Amylostereum chailletii]